MDSTTYDDETVVRVDETTAMMAVHLPRIQNLAGGVPVWRSRPLPTTRQYLLDFILAWLTMRLSSSDWQASSRSKKSLKGVAVMPIKRLRKAFWPWMARSFQLRSQRLLTLLPFGVDAGDPRCLVRLMVNQSTFLLSVSPKAPILQ
jgi:hypothetical protein